MFGNVVLEIFSQRDREVHTHRETDMPIAIRPLAYRRWRKTNLSDAEVDDIVVVGGGGGGGGGVVTAADRSSVEHGRRQHAQ